MGEQKTNLAKLITDFVSDKVLPVDWDRIMDGQSITHRGVSLSVGEYDVVMDVTGTFQVDVSRGDWWNEPQYELRSHTCIESIQVFDDESEVVLPDYDELAIALFKKIRWA